MLSDEDLTTLAQNCGHYRFHGEAILELVTEVCEARRLLREARLWVVTSIQPPTPQRVDFLARRRDFLNKLDAHLGPPPATPSHSAKEDR